MKNAWKATLGLAFLTLAGTAEAGVEKCVMQISRNQNGTIAPEIFMLYDPSDKTVEVYDGMIAAFNKETPIRAKITSETANSRSFGWSLFTVNRHGQRAKMQYLATYFVNTKTLHLQSRPIGYVEVYSTTGSCSPAS